LTERCIMESLNYRIMPLCDEDCLTDAMVDMQLASQQPYLPQPQAQPAIPESVDDRLPSSFVPAHSRSKTMSSGQAIMGMANTLTPVESPGANMCTPTPVSLGTATCYFDANSAV
jgi:hypothetical protein